MAIVAVGLLWPPPSAPRPCSRVSCRNAGSPLSSSFVGVGLRLHSSRIRARPAALATTVCKMKTHKAMAKRFRVTGSGVIVRRRAGKQHLLAKKSTKRRKRLSKMVPVSRRDYRGIIRGMPYLKVKRRHVLRSRRLNVTGSVPAPQSLTPAQDGEGSSPASPQAE